MDAKLLAGKQKRYNNWKRFASEELQDPSLLPAITSHLEEYRLALAEVWRIGTTEKSLLFRIESLERILADLNNEARLRVPGRVKAQA
jgi:hypothetical protein